MQTDSYFVMRLRPASLQHVHATAHSEPLYQSHRPEGIYNIADSDQNPLATAWMKLDAHGLASLAEDFKLGLLDARRDAMV